MTELCELCKARRLTEWLYDDEICWMAKCTTCDIWMIVLKRHTMRPTDYEFGHMNKVIKTFFPYNITLRKNQRKIPDHLHWHILEDKRNDNR